jgi:RNase P/RNase MRP subunit POP5
LLEKTRRRYILAKIDCYNPPHEKDFQNALLSSIIRLFGEYGASQTDLSLIEYNYERKYAIVRCSHKALPIVRAAMAAVNKIGSYEAAIHVLLVSGTLKALRRKIPTILGA